MSLINVEPIFLRIKGGWLNPQAILAVETHRDNDAMLTLRVTGYDRPLTLNEQDSAYISEYLESRTWPKPKQEPQAKEVPPRPEPKLMVLDNE